MIKKVTVTKVKINDRPYRKEQDGVDNPLYTFKKGKNIGKNFVMVSIQTDATGEEYYSTPSLPTEKPAKIKEGDSVLLNLTETQSEDGTKTFKNFNFPTKDQLVEFANNI